MAQKTGYRQLSRWKHEAVVERHRQRMAKMGSKRMRQRAGIVERPFGTMKLWFGARHFFDERA